MGIIQHLFHEMMMNRYNENALTLTSDEETGGSLLPTYEAGLFEEGALGRKLLDCEGFDAPRDVMPY